MNDKEKLEKIKKVAESFNYWSMTLATASEMFQEILDIVNGGQDV